MRALIRGYYGAGNFGDDILALVAHASVTQFIASDCVAVECLSNGYLRDLLGGAQLVPRAMPDRDDVVILGGGGLFYDFSGGNRAARIAEIALPTVGARTFGAAYNLLKRVKGRTERPWGKYNIAYGLGIGPYAAGSRNRLLAAGILSHFSGIAVRDAVSYRICEEWGLSDRTEQFTDIAFLDRFWKPALASPARSGDRIAIVVRDWKHAPTRNSYVASLVHASRQLRARGLTVTIVSFDDLADRSVVAQFDERFERLTWLPSRYTLSDFASRLAQHDVIVSARAHGAILGACLGVPSICVAIEPKLTNVASMLANSASVWEPPFDAALLLDLLGSMLRNADSRSQLDADLARNRKAAEAGLSWLGHHLANARMDT